jgi:hypothetical protein
MRTRRSIVHLLICVSCTIALGGCWDSSPPPPPPGEHGVYVPFYHQDTPFFCTEACLQMWEGFAWARVHSQQEIYDYMKLVYPDQVSEYGASPTAVASGANYFVGNGFFEDAFYAGDNLDLALADLHKNLQLLDPTLSIVDAGLHAVMVTGTSWQVLSTANPQVDYLVIQDPERYSQWRPTIGEWRNGGAGNACSGGICMEQIQRQGHHSIGATALSEFEYDGGVYSGEPPAGATGRWKIGANGCYWDQNDSGPDQCSPDNPTGRYKLDGNGNCYWDPNDSGPDQCSPELVRNINVLKLAFRSVVSSWSNLLAIHPAARGSFVNGVRTTGSSSRRLAMNSPGARLVAEAKKEAQLLAPTRATRRNISIPKPWATSRDDIIANFRAGIARTGMDRIPGMEKLTMQDSDWTVRDVIPVTSLGTHANYYLLHIVDRTGFIVAAGAITEEGWLMGLEDSLGREHHRPMPLAAAEAAVRGHGANAHGLRSRYVYAPGNLEPGGSVFAPLVEVDDQATGRSTYINTRGERFVASESNP